jgi:hypothetical protein
MLTLKAAVFVAWKTRVSFIVFCPNKKKRSVKSARKNDPTVGGQ